MRLTRIVVSEPGPGAAEGLRAQLTSPEFEIVGYARDGLEAAQMALRLTPDVLLVHEDLPGLSGYRACQLVAAASVEVAVVILAAQESEAALRRAMAAGARAVVALDSPGERIADVTRQAAGLRAVRAEPEYPLVTDPQRMPVTIAVTSARGGAGRTTVAVNLAALFAKRFPGEVALVDFHGQFGDVPLALDLATAGGTGELISFDELDADLVRGQLLVHPASGLRVLAAPDLQSQPDLDLGRITIPFMASLLGLLRRVCRFVFFDMPPLVWPTSQYVFTRSQHVLIVSTLADLHGIRNTRALIDIISAGTGDPGRISVIANRANARGDYNLQDLQHITGRTAYAELPDDPETACGALNTGVPVVLEAPNSVLARALTKLSDKLIAGL